MLTGNGEKGLRVLELIEVEEPCPELVGLATRYQQFYDILRDRVYRCARGKIPGATFLGDRIVFELSPVSGHSRMERRKGHGGSLSPEALRLLREWGATDIDPMANTLTWWDGRRMRIGRAFTVIARTVRDPAWREKERERRKAWASRRAPDRMDEITRLPEDIPDPATILSWMESLSRTVEKGAKVAGRDTVAVLTFDAVENIHRSARRGWVSCYDPERYRDPDMAWRNVLLALSRLDLVIWLAQRDDAERLFAPVGRTAVRVFWGAHGGVKFSRDETYGDVSDWWHVEVDRILDALNRTCGREGEVKTAIILPPTEEFLDDLEELGLGSGYIPTMQGPPSDSPEIEEALRLELPEEPEELAAFLRNWYRRKHGESGFISSVLHAFLQSLPEETKKQLLDIALRDRETAAAVVAAAPRSDEAAVLKIRWLLPELMTADAGELSHVFEVAADRVPVGRLHTPAVGRFLITRPRLLLRPRIWKRWVAGGPVEPPVEYRALMRVRYGSKVSGVTDREILGDPRLAREYVRRLHAYVLSGGPLRREDADLLTKLVGRVSDETIAAVIEGYLRSTPVPITPRQMETIHRLYGIADDLPLSDGARAALAVAAAETSESRVSALRSAKAAGFFRGRPGENVREFLESFGIDRISGLPPDLLVEMAKEAITVRAYGFLARLVRIGKEGQSVLAKAVRVRTDDLDDNWFGDLWGASLGGREVSYLVRWFLENSRNLPDEIVARLIATKPWFARVPDIPDASIVRHLLEVMARVHGVRAMMKVAMAFGLKRGADLEPAVVEIMRDFSPVEILDALSDHATARDVFYEFLPHLAPTWNRTQATEFLRAALHRRHWVVDEMFRRETPEPVRAVFMRADIGRLGRDERDSLASWAAAWWTFMPDEVRGHVVRRLGPDVLSRVIERVNGMVPVLFGRFPPEETARVLSRPEWYAGRRYRDALVRDLRTYFHVVHPALSANRLAEVESLLPLLPPDARREFHSMLRKVSPVPPRDRQS